MRGEFIGVWSETWREIWIPLTDQEDVREDVFCELYRELATALKTPPSVEVLADVIDDTDVEHVVTTGVGDLLGWPKSSLTNFVLRYIKKTVPAYRFSNRITFRQALRSGAGKALDEVDIGYADIAYLQYTGGTTGVSKGAMLSHRNMVYNVQQTITWQGDAYVGVEPIIAVTALPLYHIFSLQGNCLTVMAQGGENLLITNPRDFEQAVARRLDLQSRIERQIIDPLGQSGVGSPQRAHVAQEQLRVGSRVAVGVRGHGRRCELRVGHGRVLASNGYPRRSIRSKVLAPVVARQSVNVQEIRIAASSRCRYSARGISLAPNCKRCSVTNWMSRS